MGKTHYLGNRTLQEGRGSKKKTNDPYSGGLNPYSQLGGANTKTTPCGNRSRNVAEAEAAMALMELGGPATVDSEIDRELE